ncbi:MAG: selenide, water dikinase SelD [Flavobacteriales bacterium]|jgi:selenide,water dikinase|nr:selenide, water dikinase SelD [Flavobacteriales bacterium]MBK6752445.1 selenide, water dikinase SelD [Flavobacteriales bacterium]MBK7752107.1 selenide, water dikinase SelD [Flavobacteriales bacterium]MBK9074417.1 selenide, water dikinase SelD [Flavobacteriales bacterium]MBK9537952.1 selenide, water dikinase SelD [Flavobacteriales bacterium]
MPLPLPPTVDPIRLTRYSHGAGCGCKIAPAVLDTILKSDLGIFPDPHLLVGYGTKDDAAVYDIGQGRALISTVDFFSPIVDDAFDFGLIAATNALSDVYAMGGRPLLAVAVLGWPVDKLAPELAARVVEGGRKACHDAGIALAGGHSIDAPEPFFGLAVTGEAPIAHIKRNDTARPGDALWLTKPLGVGILTTALKRDILRSEHAKIATELMCQSNQVGTALGAIPDITAMTDITGFGLLGHLLEMCEGSCTCAQLDFMSVPVVPEAHTYLALGAYPDGSFRNWKSYSNKVEGAGSMDRMMILSDPQTSGGLLIATSPDLSLELGSIMQRMGARARRIGTMLPFSDGPRIRVE